MPQKRESWVSFECKGEKGKERERPTNSLTQTLTHTHAVGEGGSHILASVGQLVSAIYYYFCTYKTKAAWNGCARVLIKLYS